MIGTGKYLQPFFQYDIYPIKNTKCNISECSLLQFCIMHIAIIPYSKRQERLISMLWIQYITSQIIFLA